MKTHTPIHTKRGPIQGALILVLAVASLLLTACDSGGESDPPPPSSSVPNPETLSAILVPADMVKEVVDGNCQSFADVDPATPLFHVPFSDARGGRCTPLYELTDPSGQPITAGAWAQAEGEVTLTCVEGGTKYDFRFEHLVPDGVYTIWHFPHTGSGGALASHPGDIHNVFRADAAGGADFSVTGASGPMTFSGMVQRCTLPVPLRSQIGDLGGELFVIVYHKDNRSWGDVPGPETTQAGHLIVMGR